MKIRERIGDFVVVSVYLAYPIQQIYFQERTEDTSFTQHDLGAEPHCSDNPGNDHCNYGLERIALHAPEDNDPISGRCDFVAVDFELMTEAKPRDLAFDQALG